VKALGGGWQGFDAPPSGGFTEPTGHSSPKTPTAGTD
jgi:hypothetical protein